MKRMDGSGENGNKRNGFVNSIPEPTENFEGSYDSGNGESPLSNHGSSGTQDGPQDGPQDGNSDITAIKPSKETSFSSAPWSLWSPLSLTTTPSSQEQTGANSKNASWNGSTVSKKPRTLPMCARCRNHFEYQQLKGHKRYCKYRNCNCIDCLNTKVRQKRMAEETALRRALAQDEEKMKSDNARPLPFRDGTSADWIVEAEELKGNGRRRSTRNRKLANLSIHREHPETILVKNKHLPAVPQPARSLEGSVSSPVSNHGRNGVLGGISNAVTTNPTSMKPPPVNVHTSPSIHMPQTQSGDNFRILMESSMQLLERFEYPKDVLKLMYVIVKYAGANLEEATMRIIEAHNEIQTIYFWNTIQMLQNASMFCFPRHTATADIGAPTYEGEVPYIGTPPGVPGKEHFSPPPLPPNAHIPSTDSPPEHPTTWTWRQEDRFKQD